MEFREVIFGSNDYRSTVALRYAVLREPLGLTFDLQDLAREEADHHLTVWEGEELLACIIMTPLKKEIVKMRQFAVAEMHQRQGIGKLLVTFSEQWAKAHGFSQIVLHARKTAVPFYLKLGYDIVGEEFLEVTIPHLKMHKNVNG